MELAFGYKDIPPTRAAWGARFIVTQDGHVDLPWDRTDTIAADADARAELIAHLEECVPMRDLTAAIRQGLSNGSIDTRGNRVVDIYHDDNMSVVGSAQASAGYFYVTAYLTGPKERI